MCQSLTWQHALLSASLAVFGSIVVTWGLRNVSIFLHVAFLPSSRPALPCHCVSVVNHTAAVVGTNEPQCVGVLAHARAHTVNPQPFSCSSFELAFPSPGNAVTPVRIVAHKWLRLK